MNLVPQKLSEPKRENPVQPIPKSQAAIRNYKKVLALSLPGDTMKKALHALLERLDSVLGFDVAYAHCDIPCGIYDPHAAQVAAHTVIRMADLIAALPKDTSVETMHKLARYTAVKEEHAELCKREIRVLWGDYFKPEHVKQYPELHELVWKAMKHGSDARQKTDVAVAEELLNTVGMIVEIFWKTKGVEVKRVKAFYPTEREFVYPKI